MDYLKEERKKRIIDSDRLALIGGDADGTYLYNGVRYDTLGLNKIFYANEFLFDSGRHVQGRPFVYFYNSLPPLPGAWPEANELPLVYQTP